MIEVIEDEETHRFRVVTFRGETLGITTTRKAADDLAELLLEAWEEGIATAAAPLPPGPHSRSPARSGRQASTIHPS